MTPLPTVDVNVAGLSPLLLQRFSTHRRTTCGCIEHMGKGRGVRGYGEVWRGVRRLQRLHSLVPRSNSRHPNAVVCW
jgi:hypothetical protein